MPVYMIVRTLVIADICVKKMLAFVTNLLFFNMANWGTDRVITVVLVKFSLVY